MKQLKATSRARKGVVAMFVAFTLTGLMGIVALSLDGGLLFLELRKARATADAAAMAAACELFRTYPADAGLDPTSAARAAATAVANGNGYGTSAASTVTVNVPPSTGPYAGRAGYVEVVVVMQVQRGFSRVFGSDTLPVRARAVARGAWVSPEAGALLLDYQSGSSLSNQSSGGFAQIDGPVIVNSNNPSAVVVTGSGSIKATEVNITGGLQLASGSTITTAPQSGNIHVGTHPTPDPLAYLPPPPVPPNGTLNVYDIGGGNYFYVLTPGRYLNLPTFNAGDIVMLKQASANSAGGVYYIAGGGLKSEGAALFLDPGTTGGVMLYHAPASAGSDRIEIKGRENGYVILTPLTSGPYTGLMLWQERSYTEQVRLEGNGLFSIRGTVYAAGANVEIKGDARDSTGTATGYIYNDEGQRLDGYSRVGSQIIARNLSLSGHGNISISYRAQDTARTRIITLVE